MVTWRLRAFVPLAAGCVAFAACSTATTSPERESTTDASRASPAVTAVESAGLSDGESTRGADAPVSSTGPYEPRSVLLADAGSGSSTEAAPSRVGEATPSADRFDAGVVPGPSHDDAAASPLTSAVDSVDVTPMLSAVIDGVYTEFKRDVIAYDGRPPMMDIFAGMTGDAPSWGSLRVAVMPSDVIVPGEYECGPDRQSFIMLIGNAGVFDTTTVVAACTIVVESAGTQPGEVFSGTFEATAYTTDGARSIALEHGTFLGVVD